MSATFQNFAREAPFFGLMITCIFCWVMHARIFDVFLNAFRIPMLVIIISLAAAAFSGRIMNVLAESSSKILFCWVILLYLSGLFGIWRSNSLKTVNGMMVMVALYTAIICNVYGRGSIRTCIWAIASSGWLVAIIPFLGRRSSEYRLAYSSGTNADPNTYAMSLCIALPAIWFLARTTKSNVMRLMLYASTLPVFYAIFSSGSRAALVSLGVILFMLFLNAAWIQKAVLLVLLAASAPILISQLDSYIWVRLKTTFVKEISETDKGKLTPAQLERLQGDTDSAIARQNLLTQSLEYTMQYPILGVGPGNFGEKLWTDYKLKTGRSTVAAETHNSYTQVSSESGIPSLILFIAIISSAFRNLAIVNKLKKRAGFQASEEMVLLARYSRLILVSQTISCFFLSYAYTGLFLMLIGLSVVVRELIENEYRTALSKQQQPAASPMPTPVGMPFRNPLTPLPSR
jgi:O-antigen ligase